jgi:hypothetical protein
MNKIIVSVIVGAIALFGFYGVFNLNKSVSELRSLMDRGLVAVSPLVGSVAVGNEYHATTTYNGSGVPTFATSQLLISNTSGTLGSVVITGAVAGAMIIKDATSTTDLSAKIVATFPASAAAGTYTFDTVLFRGLLVTTSAGLVPTTTITYRNN